MQDSWLSSKADEIQSFADRKDIKKFFDWVFGITEIQCLPESTGLQY